jgi:acetoin utilization deacetylase AcuC-like enzyme
MNFGYRERCLDHDPGPRHPESPDRLRAVHERLAGCHGVSYTAPDSAPVAAATAVHDPDYVEAVRQFCADGGGSWDADTVAVEATWEAALASAGLATWAARAALAGADGRDTPFALGRPPGHHAVEDDAMGFCFLNNVAVAAQLALDGDSRTDGAHQADGDRQGDGTDADTDGRDGPAAADTPEGGDASDDSGTDDGPGGDDSPGGDTPGGVDRVAVLDWDVHHGNGTQDIFLDRGDVFFASLHEDGIYPGTGDSAETGTGPGEGATLNVPFPPGTTTSGYLAAVDDLVLPAFAAHDPDLVLVSAGFDAHEHDPISRMRVSTEGYGLLAQRLARFAEWADAPLAFVLEGGYGLDTLSDSVRVVHEVFDGYQPAPADEAVQAGARAVVDDVRDRGFDLAETPDFGTDD